MAQGGTTSPYSFYGIGIQKFKGTAENRSMAGIGVFSDSIHLNLQNPASVADLRLVNYTVGLSYKNVTQKNATDSQITSTTSLDYIAVGIPMGKFGASFGLVPFTSVGYNLNSVVGDVGTQSSGEGGLNRAFLSLGYKVNSKLNVGLETNYSFGNIENTILSKDSNLELGTLEVNSSDLFGFNFNLGVNYKTMVTSDLELTSSLVYGLGTSITSENSRDISSLLISPAGQTLPLETESIAVADSDFTFPSQLTLGVGIGKPKNWAVALEYANQKTSNFTNRFVDLDNSLASVEYTNASKIKIGGFYIPNYNSIGSYWKRIVYRAGIRFEQSGIKVVGQEINEFGISFGVGIPAGKLFSNVNLGFEVGTRGTTDFGLIQENFFNTFLSLSLNDRWFEKRYYD